MHFEFDLFFFSSRRRHTRSKRDWSSDVCSSDLTPSWKVSREPQACACGSASCPTTARLARGKSRHCSIVLDRKSTRLNSSHVSISYAVFCLKKKKKIYRYNVLNNNLRSPDYYLL